MTVVHSKQAMPLQPQTDVRMPPRQSGPNLWLAIFATLTSLMLVVDLLCGLRLPRSLIFWSNPFAWLSNWIGLTAHAGGFLRGMDLGAKNIAALVGIPVIGSFVLWFVWGLGRWRWPSVAFIVLTLPILCAMQFTTERAYEQLAQRYQVEGRIELESRALSKALFIIRASKTVDPDAARLEGRLSEIQRSNGSPAP